jgi:ribosomal protein S6
MEDTGKLTKEYDIGFLVRKEEDIPAVRRMVEQHGGAVVADFRAKKLALAYPIQKETEAVFVFGRFAAEPAGAKQLEHDLGNENIVLRSLITIPFKVRAADAAGTGKKWDRSNRPVAPAPEAKSVATRVLSNEALEKKIEEMLK